MTYSIELDRFIPVGLIYGPLTINGITEIIALPSNGAIKTTRDEAIGIILNDYKQLEYLLNQNNLDAGLLLAYLTPTITACSQIFNVAEEDIDVGCIKRPYCIILKTNDPLTGKESGELLTCGLAEDHEIQFIGTTPIDEEGIPQLSSMIEVYFTDISTSSKCKQEIDCSICNKWDIYCDNDLMPQLGNSNNTNVIPDEGMELPYDPDSVIKSFARYQDALNYKNKLMAENLKFTCLTEEMIDENGAVIGTFDICTQVCTECDSGPFFDTIEECEESCGATPTPTPTNQPTPTPTVTPQPSSTPVVTPSSSIPALTPTPTSSYQYGVSQSIFNIP
jgi:hypothetical protein